MKLLICGQNSSKLMVPAASFRKSLFDSRVNRSKVSSRPPVVELLRPFQALSDSSITINYSTPSAVFDTLLIGLNSAASWFTVTLSTFICRRMEKSACGDVTARVFCALAESAQKCVTLPRCYQSYMQM